MAEHLIQARLHYDTREAERALDRLGRVTERAERQTRKLTETQRMGSRAVSDTSFRHIEESLTRQIRLIDKLTSSHERLGKTVVKVNDQITRGGQTRSAAVNTSRTGIDTLMGRYLAPAAIAASAYRFTRAGIEQVGAEQKFANDIKFEGGDPALIDAVRQLATELPRSFDEIAQAAVEAVDAQLSTSEAKLAAKKGAQIATATHGQITSPEATKALIDMAMNFGMKPTEANISKMGDLFLGTTRAGRMGPQELAQILPRFLPTAQQSGMSPEQAMAMLVQATSGGRATKQGAMAATSVMNQILDVTNDKKERGKFERMGVRFTGDPTEMLQQFAKLSAAKPKEFADALGLSAKELGDFSTIFSEGGEGLKKSLADLAKTTGIVDTQSSEASKELKSQMDMLSSAAKDVAGEFLKTTHIVPFVVTGLQGFAQTLRDFGDPGSMWDKLTKGAEYGNMKEGFEKGTLLGGAKPGTPEAKAAIDAFLTGQGGWATDNQTIGKEDLALMRKKDALERFHATTKPGFWGYEGKDKEKAERLQLTPAEQKRMMALNKSGGNFYLQAIDQLSTQGRGLGMLSGKEKFTAESFSRELKFGKQQSSMLDPAVLTEKIKAGLANLKKVDAKQIDMAGQTINLRGAINLAGLSLSGLLGGNRGAGGNQKGGEAGTMSVM